MDFCASSLNVTITAEGPSETLFEDPIQGNDDNNAAVERERDEGGEDNLEEMQLLPLGVSAGRNMIGDIFLELSNARFKVDDKNEPVPENIPVSTTVDSAGDTVIDRNAIAAEDWGFYGVSEVNTKYA